jgi:hypothetical protein
MIADAAGRVLKLTDRRFSRQTQVDLQDKSSRKPDDGTAFAVLEDDELHVRPKTSFHDLTDQELKTAGL